MTEVGSGDPAVLFVADRMASWWARPPAFRSGLGGGWVGTLGVLPWRAAEGSGRRCSSARSPTFWEPRRATGRARESTPTTTTGAPRLYESAGMRVAFGVDHVREDVARYPQRHVSRLRARCPRLPHVSRPSRWSRLSSAIRAGGSSTAGLVRVPRAWGEGGEAMVEAACLALPFPEVATSRRTRSPSRIWRSRRRSPSRPLVLGGCCCAHVGAIEGLAARHDRLASSGWTPTAI